MLFNEPKLLKSYRSENISETPGCFSALQRAEIAEIRQMHNSDVIIDRFSALQRAEIAEIFGHSLVSIVFVSFSALQRAEIAEMGLGSQAHRRLFGFQCSSTSRNC